MKTDFGVERYLLTIPSDPPDPGVEPKDTLIWGTHYDVTMEDGYIVETDKLIRALGLNFHVGSALKYIVRSAPSQGKPGESRDRDLRKAVNMLHREITGYWSTFGKPSK